MATTDDTLAIRHLEAARSHLLARGDAEAVKSLDAIIERLDGHTNGTVVEREAKSVPPKPMPAKPSPERSAPDGLINAQEAAELLDVSSVSPIWCWVKEGRLTYQLVNGRAWITRDSVEKLVGDPVVEAEQKYAAELHRVLTPFDATDEDLAEMYDWWPGTQATGD